MFDRILVICTGNICRSPIAEGLLKARLSGKQVWSAGTMAMVGHGADPYSVEVSAEYGLDISAHRAQQLTLPMLQNADLVLTLDGSHSAWINGRYPQFRGKVHKLGKWRKDEDVPDPYRHPREDFVSAYQQMEAQVGDWLSKLK
ncbi:low molecular weight phosphotyrosine protein phosphatase [Stagnimonas aquatica]|uniref:protein-tyrosine-phosphatase n=1 Tax=Stagnimonas aquatica TaxID=2689987 RepID=A0A3N0VGP8_9GAMM|nr:low molecular weight protein-tyrosine-phosphatase [Stagnimonas aquatica]ROH91953.1 low molecular weight phosphotyrosine protein phosphatase [Stagnimonas aquatica]